jgi:hypothetical protein
MDTLKLDAQEGSAMANDDETILTNPGPGMTEHVEGYESFTRLFKWGAIVCLVIGLLWMLIVKAYW